MTQGIRITPEQDALIRKMLAKRERDSSVTYKEIAKKAGVSLFAVQSRGPKKITKKPITEATRAEIVGLAKSGELTYRQISEQTGVSWGAVFSVLQKSGLTRQQDMRSWDQKVESWIERLPSGCWKWNGKTSGTIHLTADVRGSSRSLVRKLLGLPERGTIYGMICGNDWCHNPEHGASSRFFDRNKDIEDRWRLHMQHRTTMDELAEEYGITRQRVEQIIRAAGLPHKWKKGRE